MKFLIAGLGNIGNEYAHTRHNIGFDVVAAFVQKHGGTFRQDRLAFVADIKWKGRIFICICPTTYMNLSGKAFKYWIDKEKIPLENTFTILDDLSLPISKLRIRGSGSDGGHNGLRSIQESVGSVGYPKLRFGIGSNFSKGMQADFVLGKWTKQEDPIVKLKIDRSVEAIEIFATQGINAAMNTINNLEFE
ncbi:aminoacyl-tRNA hydrolase [Niabella sp. 22666]|jgi:PTH1 family peptidyl-tRNA hydrolase|uniref:aminoacyl-tRNA hydrolase n=1 Tax=Niabella sp. 22666 TaxID=3453954 RepID=UPI003F875DEB